MENNDLRHVDPAEVDGPGPEFYRELAEDRGAPWPRGAHITRLSRTVGFALARAQMTQTWPCGRCGGPRVCPDLAATLAYRKCGYAEVDGRGWIHQ